MKPEVKIRYKTWYWGNFVIEGSSVDGVRVTRNTEGYSLYDEEKDGWHNSEEYKNGWLRTEDHQTLYKINESGMR